MFPLPARQVQTQHTPHFFRRFDVGRKNLITPLPKHRSLLQTDQRQGATVSLPLLLRTARLLPLVLYYSHAASAQIYLLPIGQPLRPMMCSASTNFEQQALPLPCATVDPHSCFGTLLQNLPNTESGSSGLFCRNRCNEPTYSTAVMLLCGLQTVLPNPIRSDRGPQCQLRSSATHGDSQSNGH